jgi:hypothetical protein
MMEDRRDPMRDPLDPTLNTAAREDALRRSNTGLGWIAGAVFLAVVIAPPPGRAAANRSLDPAAVVDIGAPY